MIGACAISNWGVKVKLSKLTWWKKQISVLVWLWSLTGLLSSEPSGCECVTTILFA